VGCFKMRYIPAQVPIVWNLKVLRQLFPSRINFVRTAVELTYNYPGCDQILNVRINRFVSELLLTPKFRDNHRTFLNIGFDYLPDLRNFSNSEKKTIIICNTSVLNGRRKSYSIVVIINPLPRGFFRHA